ncbi:MAG: GNAT family N-acetyltransferase [Planctomycetota bacterium]
MAATPAITLVRPAARYRPDIQRLASDARVAATCNVPHPYPADGAERWLAIATAGWRSGSHHAYLVLDGDSCCGVMTIARLPGRVPSCHVDYWIGAPYQGRGIGSAALARTLALARTEHGLGIAFSGCLQRNQASVRILERNGFRRTAGFLNAGIYGSKFLDEWCWRYRLDLDPAAAGAPDPTLHPPEALAISWLEDPPP